MAREIKVSKHKSLPEAKLSKIRKKPGSGNAGKYKNVSSSQFCGAAGGSSKYSYPVNTKKRARAALAYAHNAPNPKGIRACVKKKFPSVGKSSRSK